MSSGVWYADTGSSGYVERFIFETSKISQLFCHQIIWNMKANCFKDDAGEIVRNFWIRVSLPNTETSFLGSPTL